MGNTWVKYRYDSVEFYSLLKVVLGWWEVCWLVGFHQV